MPIVTIARELGAGGSAVASILAARLGAEIVDKSLIDEVARRASLATQEVEDEDEHGRSLFDRCIRLFAPLSEAWAGTLVRSDDLLDHHQLIISVTRAVLQEAARSGNAVIVGRGSAAELRDCPGAVHVFLWAPMADRVRAIRERIGCDEATARHRIRTVDGARAAYVYEVYGVDWHDRELYDITLNTARLGHTGAADAVLGSIRRKMRSERGWVVLHGGG